MRMDMIESITDFYRRLVRNDLFVKTGKKHFDIQQSQYNIGKTILPFITHEGSRMGRNINDN